MSRVKVFGLALLLGLLSVAITVAAFVVAAFVAFITPFAIVFTGLCFGWWVVKEHRDEQKND